MVIAGATFSAGCLDNPTATRDSQDGVAPFFAATVPQRPANRYIVVLKDTVTDVGKTVERLTRTHGGSVSSTYRRVLRGFSATLSGVTLGRLRADPAVLYISQVNVGRLDDHNYVLGGPWALQRITQRTLPLKGWYSWSETGSGVRVYIVDSGIRTAHTQFGGRASIGFDARPQDGQNGQDCLGHGTHVAGSVGGSTYGVAKSVSLIAVRVTTACTGSYNTNFLLDGLEWVAENHINPSVINMSLGEPANNSVDSAVAALTALGITVVVSAGNEGQDACNKSPARAPEAITVGATTSSDARWTSQTGSSNVGSCVDLFAPGADILSAWYTSNSATQTRSGTSMATPHVSGATARYLQFRTTAAPSEVSSVISARATQGVLTNIGTGSPNRLLYTHLNDASVSGPTSCSNGTQQTWTATASGGVGSTFTYTWQRGSPTGFGGGMVWVNVGSGAIYSQSCTPEPGTSSLWLRVNATDEFGFHRTVNHSVNVTS